jgi:DNA-binding LytR/AlgR family response regulator
MYKIAIVDDEWEAAEKLKQCFDRYAEENGEAFNVVRFKNGLDFIDEYTSDFDMVFMDIDMPHMSGLQTARELRKKDMSVALVFVTVLAKYAINGYEYNALDYILKPINYNSFNLKMERILRYCSKQKKKQVALPATGGSLRIEISDLNYVEICGHDIIYHTSNGDVRAYGTMRMVEKILPENEFFKCNRCYLVNLRNVTRLNGDYVEVGSEQLSISRARKAEFIDALNGYHTSNR